MATEIKIIVKDGVTIIEGLPEGTYTIVKQDERKPWEPEGGNWFVSSQGIGNIFEVPGSERVYDGLKDFGVLRKTKGLAERASKEIRIFNRLLAYRDEFCPEYEPDWSKNNSEDKYTPYFNGEKWVISRLEIIKYMTVYFPLEIAEELVKKLNSEEVRL